MNYEEVYNQFIEDYTSSEMTGEGIGRVIVQMAHFYSQHNSELSKATRVYYKERVEIANSVDEVTGKPMAVGKAEIVAQATDNFAKYNEEKRNVENIEQMINALKSLQKSVLQEYSQAGLI